jgi:hypothetical protein
MPAFTRRRFGSSAISDADGTTVWVNPWEFPDSKKRSQRARISADSTNYTHSAFFFFFERDLFA